MSVLVSFICLLFTLLFLCFHIDVPRECISNWWCYSFLSILIMCELYNRKLSLLCEIFRCCNEYFYFTDGFYHFIFTKKDMYYTKQKIHFELLNFVNIWRLITMWLSDKVALENRNHFPYSCKDMFFSHAVTCISIVCKSIVLLH
jgi:hypothetical protein